VLALLRQLATSRVGVLSLRAPPLRIPKSRITLFSGPQHNCRLSPQWHVARSGGSTSPLVTSSGPTTLACLLNSLARGTHPCTHVHSKKNPTVRLPLRSTAQIFSVFWGFGHWEFVHPTSRTFVYRNPELRSNLTLDPMSSPLLRSMV